MLSSRAMHERMVKGWRSGVSKGTVCGQASILANTQRVRNWLPRVVDKYDIYTVCDAGAGDLTWINRVDWKVSYKAFDLIPRTDAVQSLDITTENLPECDAVLCRMVLNHLYGDKGDDLRILMALERFKRSAKYLIATQFDGKSTDRKRQFTRLDLSRYLGEPLEKTQDGHEDNCFLAIWKL